jgi:hypothetical protein
MSDKSIIRSRKFQYLSDIEVVLKPVLFLKSNLAFSFIYLAF